MTADALENVLTKIVVPRYNLVGVDVRYIGWDLDNDNFRVIYYFNPPIENKDAVSAMDDSIKLFRMMGPNKRGDIIVTFEKWRDED